MSGELGIPVYLVSLAEDEGRRERLRSSFPRYYKTFLRVDAVDGRKLSAKEYFRLSHPFFKDHQRLMTPGELGCSLSHIRALKDFLDTKNEYALVIEDDVLGCDEDLERIAAISTLLPKNSILICGGQEGLGGRRVLGKSGGMDDLFRLAQFSYAYIYRTCCYVLDREAAGQVLRRHNQGVVIADWWSVLLEGSAVKMHYAKLLAHPEELSGSHLQQERVEIGGHGRSIGGWGLSAVLGRLSWARLKKKVYRLGRDIHRLCLIAAGYKVVGR